MQLDHLAAPCFHLRARRQVVIQILYSTQHAHRSILHISGTYIGILWLWLIFGQQSGPGWHKQDHPGSSSIRKIPQIITKTREIALYHSVHWCFLPGKFSANNNTKPRNFFGSMNNPEKYQMCLESMRMVNCTPSTKFPPPTPWLCHVH